MSYRFTDSLWAGAFAPTHKLSANLYDIHHCCVYRENLLLRNFPKHVEFHSKNKFEKLVHLVGFIVRNTSATFINAIDVFYSHICPRYSKWCFVILNEIIVVTYFLNYRPNRRQKKLRLKLLCALYSVNKFTITMYKACLMFFFFNFNLLLSTQQKIVIFI